MQESSGFGIGTSGRLVEEVDFCGFPGSVADGVFCMGLISISTQCLPLAPAHPRARNTFSAVTASLAWSNPRW